MTNPTPHGQVPEALIDLIDAYAETRHRCGGIYNARTEAARKAVIEALSGVQALSAAPAVPTSVKGAMWFTKKPVTIQAIQWTGENLREVITFTDGPPDTRSHHAGMAWDAYRDLVARDGLKIYTLEGKMLASPGDWIIRGVKGELYPCKPDIFQETYAAASPTPPAEQPDITKLTERGAVAWAGVDAQELRDGTYQQGATKAAPGEPFDECFPGEPRVAVPQGLISAACFAIRNKRDDGKVLEQLRRYSVGDLSQPLAPQQEAPKAAPGEPSYSEKWDAELGRAAMRFVDRAGDVHPGIDDAETICAEFYKAMSEVIERMPHVQRMTPRKAAPGVGNSGFDHKTAADFLSGKTVSDEAVRKFVAASRWAHDEKAALSAMLLSVRGVLASREAEIALLKKALLEAEAAPQQEAQEPCQTCIAMARTVMLDQVSFDRKPDCYGIRQITDDDGIEEWEDIRTSPDVAREEANDMMATGRGEIYEVVPLWTTPQPAPLSDEVVKDAARLDWLALAGPTSICVVIDRPHDSEVEVATDDVTGYGKTLREALDAAIAAQGGKV